MNNAPDHTVLVENTLLVALCDFGALALFILVAKEVIGLVRSGKLRIGDKEYDPRLRPFACYGLLAVHVVSVLLMTLLASVFSLTIMCRGYDLACGAYHGWQRGLWGASGDK